MATPSSTLAWKIPWTEEPGRLSPWGHKESDKTEQIHLILTLKYSIVYMYHNFSIHSSIDGHRGCFHVLAIANSAAMNIAACVFFQFWFPWGIFLGVVLLGHMVVLFLAFKGISIWSSIVVVSVYIPTSNARVSPFLHTLSSIYCL